MPKVNKMSHSKYNTQHNKSKADLNASDLFRRVSFSTLNAYLSIEL